METSFRTLAELCSKLEATSKRTLMVNLVATFLKDLNLEEVEPATSMILGRVFPKWDSRSLEISWSTLRETIRGITQVDWQDYIDAYSRTGDVGAAAEAVFAMSKIRKQTMLVDRPLTILEVRCDLEAVANATGSGSRERKGRLLKTLMGRTTPLEAKYLVKVIAGEMRTGFHEGLMELAVSKAFAVPQELVRKASMLVGDIAEVATTAKSKGIRGVQKFQFRVFRPIRPMLAQMAESLSTALKEHGGTTAFEFKLDGARVQIHKLDAAVKIY
ncbi:MAG: DNA ligase, partial [Candidatus Bathyarchaeota archaeon]